MPADRVAANALAPTPWTPTGTPSRNTPSSNAQASGDTLPRDAQWNCRKPRRTSSGSPTFHATTNGLRSGGWIPAAATSARLTSSASSGRRNSRRDRSTIPQAPAWLPPGPAGIAAESRQRVGLRGDLYADQGGRLG